MTKSSVHQYVHVIFSTKYRQLLITAQIEDSIFNLIRSVSDELNVPILALNGTEDHIHLLCKLPSSISLATYVNRIKGKSSFLVKQKLLGQDEFYWQNSYYAVTVSQKTVRKIVHYIENQKKLRRQYENE